MKDTRTEARALRRQRLQTVAARAIAGYEKLPPAERIELLLSVALILPRAEAEAARLAAFTLQEAEAQQLKFSALLTPRPKA